MDLLSILGVGHDVGDSAGEQKRNDWAVAISELATDAKFGAGFPLFIIVKPRFYVTFLQIVYKYIVMMIII